MVESVPIAKNDATKIYEELCKLELSTPLINLFKREVDPLTLRYGFGKIYYTNEPNHKDKEIYAKVDNSELSLAMALRQRKEGLILDFYSGDIEDILLKGESDSVFCDEFASISAMPKKQEFGCIVKGMS